MPRVMTVILGGGRGTRLFPLTKNRAKPAVPLGGKYRLIDIPVSNAINSGFPHVYVLTQFNSASLNQHVTRTYQFDQFHDGFVRVLAAEQTDEAEDWYQGTADAVRKQMRHFDRPDVEHVLVLSGDHLYRMDYRKLVERHEEAGADCTVACIPIDEAEGSRFGLLSPDEDGLVTSFVEKPKSAEGIASVRVPETLRARWGLAAGQVLASMGVYVFRRQALIDVLDGGATDFGSHILPAMLGKRRIAAHLFHDYWADIGTIRAFFDANLSLTAADPPFRFWDENAPIYTHARILPASKLVDAVVRNTVIAEGSYILASSLERCVLGVRSRVGQGSRLSNTIVMGADYYETDAMRSSARAEGRASLGVGAGCEIDQAIIDKNARIGDGSVLRGSPELPDTDGPGWFIRDGIVVVEKGADLPPGTRVGR